MGVVVLTEALDVRKSVFMLICHILCFFVFFYNTTVIFQSHITLRNTGMLGTVPKPQPLLSTAGKGKSMRKVTQSRG